MGGGGEKGIWGPFFFFGEKFRGGKEKRKGDAFGWVR